VEPHDSLTAFTAAMLGRVDANGVHPIRTLPAAHFLYPWCLATACAVVPYDPRSFSYMGGTYYQTPGTLANIVNAVQTYKGARHNLDPAIDTPFVAPLHSNQSAGVFVTVTYLPVLIPASTSNPSPNMDQVNWRLEPGERTNVINSGLKLITPPLAVNLGGAWGLLYPAAGIAPVLKEQYLEFYAERRMLLPTFDLTQLARYVNAVNYRPENFPGGTLTGSWVTGTVRFAKYTTEFVQVPQVDANGERNGYNRWLNLVLKFDFRTTQAQTVYDGNGALPAAGSTGYVTWNHVLAYPGTMSWLNGALAGTPAGLGWYRAKFSRNSLGVDSDAYPGVDIVVGKAASIFDPCTENW